MTATITAIDEPRVVAPEVVPQPTAPAPAFDIVAEWLPQFQIV